MPPVQKLNGPLAVMFGAGVGLTVTVVPAVVAEHPFASVAVTEYVPLLVTLIELLVALVLQR